MNAAAGHDDSGTGIRTPDEDFSMGKYDYGVDDFHSQMVPAPCIMDCRKLRRPELIIRWGRSWYGGQRGEYWS